MPPSAERSWSLAPSALLSSRWSRDNLITPEMARLYTGKVLQRVGVDELQAQLEHLSRLHGALEVETGSLGVLSWNIRCTLGGKRSLLLVPLAQDDDGIGGRSKRAVPQRCFETARHFWQLGLRRYLLEPETLLELDRLGPAACFSLPPSHEALTFGLGSARIDLMDDEGAWVVHLGRAPTAQLTRELLAALAYHYDAADGTSITDVLVNDGDFLARRTSGGQWSLRLTTARRLERGIEPERFLLYLIQLMAYEDWNIGQDLVGLPVAVADPLLALEGFTRGQAWRSEDLGQGAQAGEERARTMIEAFGRSRDGRAYFPWVERFLAGAAADQLDEPRRPWWNLNELEQRRELVRLREGDAAAEPMARLIEGLEAAVGVGSEDAASDSSVRANDLDRQGVLGWLARQGLSADARERAADAWFAGWPYRGVAQLTRQVPGLRECGAAVLPLDFAVAPGEEEGTLAALARLPQSRPVRALANPEIYGTACVEANAQVEAVRLLSSFETFMDDVLHDPRFGYYAHRVVIGRGGHFSTHPEDLTPHYGRWVAGWAFEVYSRMVDGGRLSPAEPFPLIEFGAGNGRLARDLIDAVRAKAASDAAWRVFSERLDYRIYELSESLRSKQQALLGGDARILQGDARNAADCLRRDFPAGLVGLVVSNELPDAFGVHKVVLSMDGHAEAVLVLARASASLLDHLSPALRDACGAADVRLRALIGRAAGNVSSAQRAGERLLDQATFREVMASIFELTETERSQWIDELWFEELLVPAACFGPLAEVLRSGASEYARALAAEESGVVTYVNVHAARFVKELASVLRCGQIVTIDYGDTTFGLVRGARRGQFPLRIYCDEGEYEPRPNYPYARPGGQDLTADVNFTDLALAGLGAKLDLCYYGPERAIALGELPLVLASTEQAPFAKFVGNPVFKVLALGRDLHFCPSGAGLEPLPLFSEPATEPAVAERVQAIQVRLTGC